MAIHNSSDYICKSHPEEVRGCYSLNINTADSTKRYMKRFASMGENIILGTHDGKFHADEALACFLLKLLPEYSNSKIIRTRDPELLEKCDVVVDVGAIYDPLKFRFDHHQRGFNEVFSSSYKTKLSSAGLIYKHFGKRVLNEVVLPKCSQDMMEAIYEKLYKDCIEEFDAVDNGISAYSSDIIPLFKTGSTSIFSSINLLNPSWIRVQGMDSEEESKLSMQQFEKAMKLAGNIVMDILDDLIQNWWPARRIVADAYDNRYKIHSSGKIMILEPNCPWENHLSELEQENKEMLYVIYHDNLHQKWMVRAVAIMPGSFVSRKALPESWRGLREDALDKVTNIPGGVFVHATGFIGGHRTKDGILALCELALKH